jgi:hypothetical protein
MQLARQARQTVPSTRDQTASGSPAVLRDGTLNGMVGPAGFHV